MKHLVLFDIDGTILNFKHSIAKELFAEMMEDFFGIDVPDSAIPNFRGMTDLQIIKSIAENIGVSYQDSLKMIPMIWEKMLEMFLPYSVSENVTIHPGIKELIMALDKDEDIKLGLVTGNFIENAYLKLSIEDLDKYFPTGAFGCDSDDRNKLPLLAIERMNKHFNTTVFNPSNTLIIGDTHRDIECAQINGIKVLAVATGGFSEKELLEANPDLVLKNFENVEFTLENIFNLLQKN